jgi:hypothetical protein
MREVMERVDSAVSTIPVESLKAFIKQMARDLRPEERASFLANLESCSGGSNDVARDFEKDESLLDDIKELSSKVDSGELCVGFGWDPEIKDERDFGDESWSEDVDDYLSRARDAVVHSHYQLARDAYDAIFSILEMAEEVGHLPGPPDPVELLKTDMDDARALYLRATYVASSIDERPAAIMNALQRFGYEIGDKYNVTCMRGAGEGELPSFNDFLNDWITFLEQPDGVPVNVHAGKEKGQYLLREATNLLHGLPGVADLARKHGSNHPKSFVDWIEQLAEKGEVEGMIAAAKEGLAAIPIDLVDRAIVGEKLVKAGKVTGNLHLQLAGWKAAFESAPTIERLASCLEIAVSLDVRDLEGRIVIDRLKYLLDHEPVKKDNSHLEDTTYSTDNLPLLLCQSLFMVGKFEEAINFLKKGSKHHIDDDDIVLFGIAYVLRTLVHSDVSESATPNLHMMWHEALDGTPGSMRETGTSTKSTVEIAFDAAMQEARVTPDLERELVIWCMEAASIRVDGIMGSNKRMDYPMAATLLCSVVEALHKLARESEATIFLDGYLKKYSRHRAFIQEMARARGRK